MPDGSLTSSLRGRCCLSRYQRELQGALAGHEATHAMHAVHSTDRIAFVLHDVFAVSFDEIASMVGRTPAGARQLASRARRRIRGGHPPDDADLSQQRQVVEAFLSALRSGDVEGPLAVLDPDVVRRADRFALTAEAATELRGAAAVMNEALAYTQAAPIARAVLVDDSVGSSL